MDGGGNDKSEQVKPIKGFGSGQIKQRNIIHVANPNIGNDDDD